MIELTFDIKPDENGICDGRELARSMIHAAYLMLTPYVDACPACADALFSTLANSAIEDLHRSNDPMPGTIMNVGADPEGARWRNHVAETSDFTEELLRASGLETHLAQH